MDSLESFHNLGSIRLNPSQPKARNRLNRVLPKCIPSFSRSFHGPASFFLSGILACMVLFLSSVVAVVSIDLFKAAFKVRCERQGFYAQFIDSTKSEVAVF